MASHFYEVHIIRVVSASKRRNWLGGWFLPQKKSYFALQLPKGWWVFGLDQALHGDINVYQFKFFAELCQSKDKEEAEGGAAQKCTCGILNIQLSTVESLKSTVSDVSLTELIEFIPQLGKSWSSEHPDKKLFSVQDFFQYTETEGHNLMAHKKLVAEKLLEEENEHKAKGQAKKEKHLAGEKEHVILDSVLDTKERLLISIATKGAWSFSGQVVQCGQ